MSEENTIEAAVTEEMNVPDTVIVKGQEFTYEKDSDGLNFIQFDPNCQIVVDTFGRNAKLLFHYPRFESDDADADINAAAAKYGKEKVRDFINEGIRSGIFGRVRSSKLPNNRLDNGKPDTNKNKIELEYLQDNRPMLFTPDEALDYVPNERELTPSALSRKIGKLMAEGQLDEAMKLLSKLNDTIARMKELQELGTE